MRTNISFPFAFACFLLLTMTSSRCKKDNKCDTPFEIAQLLPDNNPAGYEIQLKGTGFTQAAVVRFGTKTAVTRWYEEESSLIAKVPSGLSGLVEVTVEEGDCIARADFEVTNGTNPDWPPSLAQIVIPQTPGSFPADFTNQWRNYADQDHQIFLESDGITPTTVGGTSQEFHFSNPILHQNPVIGTIDIAQNKIHLTIDRSLHGGINDTLDGQFILPAAAGITDKDFAIWLQSKVSGRQMVLVQL